MAGLSRWIAALFLLPVPFAVFNAGRRRRLVDGQASIDGIRALSCQEFEQLVGEVYRRQGYRVTERGGAGADGGIESPPRRPPSVPRASVREPMTMRSSDAISNCCEGNRSAHRLHTMTWLRARRAGGLRVFALQLGDIDAGCVDVLEHGRGPEARGTVYAIEQTVLVPVDTLHRVLAYPLALRCRRVDRIRSGH